MQGWLNQEGETSPVSAGSTGLDQMPAPRQYAPPTPHKIDSTVTTRRDLSPSISEFYQDAEFVEFLKQIELFVRSEGSPQHQNHNLAPESYGFSQRSFLYKNLQGLRERYQEFSRFR